MVRGLVPANILRSAEVYWKILRGEKLTETVADDLRGVVDWEVARAAGHGSRLSTVPFTSN